MTQDKNEISADQIEALGQMADSLDSALYAAKMPLPPALHIEGLSGIVRSARDLLAQTVKDVTGEDPWETNPLEG